MQSSPDHIMDPPFEQTGSASAPQASARWNTAKGRLKCPALPSSPRSEQTGCFVRHSYLLWLRAWTKIAVVEIPLFLARNCCNGTTGIASLEDEMCAKVLRKIHVLLPKGRMIPSWQREESGLWVRGRCLCRSSSSRYLCSILKSLSVVDKQTLLEWGWCSWCWESWGAAYVWFMGSHKSKWESIWTKHLLTKVQMKQSWQEFRLCMVDA